MYMYAVAAPAPAFFWGKWGAKLKKCAQSAPQNLRLLS